MMEGLLDEKLGLTTAEAYYLHKIHGKNEINITSEPSIFFKYISHFKDSMIMLLLASAVVSVILGEYEDAVSIFIAIFIVVTVAFIQEYNSDQSVAAISKLLPPQCICYRDGRAIQMMAVELVPGDYVILRMGDKVPADIKLVESVNLKVDESNLSGESRGVDKQPTFIDVDSSIQNNILYMGTFISYGHAKGVVIATGINTQFGKLYSLMSNEEAPKSPLKLNMEYLGKQISFYSTIIICGIVLLGIIQNRKLFPMLTMGVSLAVAAIPEGLPIVVTVTLALGTIRMAKKRAIVKKLHVVESLGCVTVFCADKTGTITSNDMSVVSIYTCEDQYIDLGLMTDATESFDGIASIHHSLNGSRVLRQILKTCCVCNNAQIGHDNSLVGQSTDCALLSLGIKCGYFPETLCIKRLGETPFSSDTKWMSVEVEDPEFPQPVYYIKGAPEIILSKCNAYINQNELYPIKDDFLFRFHSKISNFSSNGFRTIAVAYGDSLGDYIFLGLIVLADPIRPDIGKTLSNFRSLGVECKILTGDSKETACSVAKSVGITDLLLKSISGDELRSVGNLEMNKMVSEAHLFYRITPVDKINIIKSLREQGHIVAMAGDGVNDAIALRAAHVGISMGKFASDACKEAADVVLTDDNIKSLIWAVREGKTIFKNIQNFVRFQISSSITALAVTSLCIILKLQPPLNSTQILWINIIMDGPPAQSLGVEPSQQDKNYNVPRSSNEQIINKKMMISIIWSSIIMIIGIFLVHYREIKLGLSRSHDTTMSFTCFVLFDLFNALNCRSQNTSIFKIGFFTNKTFIYSVIASLFGQILVIYLPFLNRVFQTTPLPINDILLAVGVSSSVFFAEELRKYITNRFYKL